MLDWCIPIKPSLAHHEQKSTVTLTQPHVFSKKFLIRDESFSLEYLFTNSTNAQSGVRSKKIMVVANSRGPRAAELNTADQNLIPADRGPHFSD